MRLARDLEALLVAARDLATKRGDTLLSEEHLLLAAAGTVTGTALLSAQAIRIDAFVQALEARIVASQPVAGYRGAAPRGNLEELLYEANDARGFMKKVFRPLGVVDVLVYALARRAKAVVRSARFDVFEIDTFSNRAIAEAVRRQHSEVFWDHALYAALEQPAVKATLADGGVDVEATRRALDLRLKALAHATMALLPERIRLLWTACSHANSTGLPVSVEPLIVAGLRAPHVLSTLPRVKVYPFDLIYAFAHRRPPLAPPKMRGMVDVAFFNDPYTTMEFVVDTLTTIFDLPKPDAQELMLAVHETGKATFGPFDAKDARRRLADVRQWGHDEGMPLRIELVSATSR